MTDDAATTEQTPGGAPQTRFERVARRHEHVIVGLLFVAASLAVVVTVAIVATLLSGTGDFFGAADQGVVEFLTGTRWIPAAEVFGILPLFTGTALVAGGAVLLGAPLGVAAALYLSEFAPDRLRAVGKPVVEVLAGIPSIVYGFFALLVISPIFQEHLGASFFNALSAIVVIAVMILPIVVSLSDDALTSVPRDLRDASRAMGATEWETSLHVVLPAAGSGVLASIFLGLARALGETMVVVLAAGSVAKLHLNPLLEVQTMTAYIAQVATGDIPPGAGRDAAFAVGLVLFVITYAINLGGQWALKRYRGVAAE